VSPQLGFSSEDATRVDRIEALARAGAESAPALVDFLDDPSWVVRRAVVAALAAVGEPALRPLVETLLERRDNEARLAATVDALVVSRAPVEREMMRLASLAVPAVVCDALQVLGRRRAREAIPSIAKLVAHEDDNVAVAAIEALGRIGGIETVEALIGAVDLRHFFRTFPAIDALGRTGDARAVAPLVALLGDPLYAPEAVRALGRTGQEKAVAPLAKLLAGASDAITRTAVVALAELRERYEARFGEREGFSSLLSEALGGRPASARIVAALEGVTTTELVAAARVLGWIGDDIAVARLVEMVMVEPPVSTAATDALRRLGARAAPVVLAALRTGSSHERLRLLPIVGYAPGSVDDLIRCLDDADPDVRVRATEALARLGNPAAVASLFRLLSDRDGRVSHAASAAIQSLGSLESKRLALQQARAEDVRTRRAALRILSYFGYREGLPLLVDALDDADEKIRETAIHGLPVVGGAAAIAALLSKAAAADTKTRAAIMRALGQTERTETVVGALSLALADPEPWVRYYACQSLGRLRVTEAADAIIARLGDESGHVRVAAVEALAHVRDGAALEALVGVARSGDPDMRRAALLGMGIAKDPAHVPTLREAAGASETATRLVAIGALSEFDTPDVVPTLAHAIRDPDASIRSAAIGYLATRPGPAATHALLEHLGEPELRDRILDALAVAGEERIDTILAELESAGPDAALHLVAALARMRRPGSQAAIASTLSMGNVHARRAAAAALAAIGTSEAREALGRIALADPDGDVRRIAATLLPR